MLKRLCATFVVINLVAICLLVLSIFVTSSFGAGLYFFGATEHLSSIEFFLPSAIGHLFIQLAISPFSAFYIWLDSEGFI